jgi:phosphatidylglycerol:prolipoprotein diacylglycerol transferase
MSLSFNQQIPFYNLLIGIGIIAGFKCFEKNEKLFNTNDQFIKKYKEWIIVALLVSSFIGAAIFENAYHSDFSSIGKYGITFYGGLITASFLSIFLLKFSISRFELMFNLLTPSVLIAHAFGRLGCALAGCCYGKYFNELNFTASYLHEIRFPVQLAEAIILFSGFIVINKFTTFEKRYLTYLLYYGISRFFLEFLRADDRGFSAFHFLSPSQVISLLVITIILFRFYVIRKKKTSIIFINSLINS